MRAQAGTPNSPRVGVTKILIADDHDVVRAGLRALLSEQPNWQVVAEAADGKEAIAQALKTAPHVAVVDYSLPVINGLEVTRQIRQCSPGTEVIIFTMHDSNSLIQDLRHKNVPTPIDAERLDADLEKAIRDAGIDPAKAEAIRKLLR